MRFLVLVFVLILAGCLPKDKEAVVGFQKNTYEAKEPVSGSFILDLPLVVEKNDFGSGPNLSISIRTDDAETSDYELITKTIDLSNQRSIKVKINSDKYYEDDETIVVSLSTLEDDVEFKSSSAIINIININPKPLYSFETKTITLTENSGPQKIYIRVSNPHESESASISVEASGVATRAIEGASGDYTIDTLELKLPEKSEREALEVNVLADSLKEGGESINLQLKDTTIGSFGDITFMSIIIPGDVIINDTGVSKFRNELGFQESSNSDLPNQDAEFGADSKSQQATDGRLGFSFIKIDRSGNPLPSNSNSQSYRCVEDENTGLIWEAKQQASVLPAGSSGKSFNEFINDAVTASKKKPDDEGYVAYPYDSQHLNWRSNSYTYYWYNTDNNVNGGAPGAKGPEMSNAGYPIHQTCAYPNEKQTSYSPDNKNCNSETYVDYANALALCGYKDWRLPEIEELRSVLDYEDGFAAFDSTFMPLNSSQKYLSATPHADAIGSAWCMDTNSKRVELCNKQLPYSIMLVRKTVQ